MKENWLPVVGYEGLYEVSDLGRIRRSDRRANGKYGLYRKSRNVVGYKYINLCKDGLKKGLQVHKLVMFAFKGPRPDGMVIDHINGDKSDNRLSNLRYCTNHQNVIFSALQKPRRKSKYMGVYKTKTSWRAMIQIKGVKIRIGHFNTEIEAHEAHNKYLKTILE